jgi:hypothetical protein
MNNIFAIIINNIIFGIALERINEKNYRHTLNVPLPDTRNWGNGIGSLLRW